MFKVCKSRICLYVTTTLLRSGYELAIYTLQQAKKYSPGISFMT